MIINFKSLNLFKLLNYIYTGEPISLLLKYWKKFYFIAIWLKFFLFPINFKLTRKKYQTQYHLLKIYWKYINKYFTIKIFLQYYSIKDYTQKFLIKNFYNNCGVIHWNELVKEKNPEYYLFLDTYFDNNIDFNIDYIFYNNFLLLKYLNICY